MSTVESKILEKLKEAVYACYNIEPEEGVLMLETPRDPKMGDYSTNIAMRLAKSLHMKPMDIALPIVAKLQETLPEAEQISAAGAGFINFKMHGNVLSKCINEAIEQGDNYGKNDSGKGEKVLVEWVSANPTGDLHCGHARNAAWGDAICRLYEASGYDCLREYYINDAGNQINMLGESLISRYFEYFGKEYPLPEDGYHAEDIKNIASEIAEKDGDKWLYEEDKQKRLDYFKDIGKELKLEKIKEDLAIYNVHMDSWIHETMFYEDNSKRINDVLDKMQEMGLTYELDGALWFKSTEYGDDKDRVLRKSDGSFSYLTPDIANHLYKYERGYSKLIDIWGADHHSYVTRMQCALTALGLPKGTLTVDITQMVRMVEDGVEVKMSKRTGNAITLRELCEDVGTDAVRWFFVSKDINTQMDFDLKLARSQDNNNPVYYAQYAHARMNSILNNPNTPEFKKQDEYARLTDPRELQLMKKIGEFPKIVSEAANNRKPNRITEYISEFVKIYHGYYAAVKVNGVEPELTNERVALVKACMITLKNALELVGVSAPEAM